MIFLSKDLKIIEKKNFHLRRNGSFSVPLMGQVAAVVQLICRGMGHENIKTAVEKDLEPQLADAAAHFLFRILKASRTVAHRTAQTEDADPLVYVDRVVNAGTAFRRGPQIFFIMISMDIEDRDGGHGREEGKVVWMKIPAGDDKIDPLHFLPVVMIP